MPHPKTNRTNPTLDKNWQKKNAELKNLVNFVIYWQVKIYKQMKATFGEYIRQLRTDKGFTLTELAALLKLDSANLSKIENNKREFDEKRLDKLANAFDLDFEKLKTEYFGEQFAKKMYQYNCYFYLYLVFASCYYLTFKPLFFWE